MERSSSKDLNNAKQSAASSAAEYVCRRHSRAARLEKEPVTISVSTGSEEEISGAENLVLQMTADSQFQMSNLKEHFSVDGMLSSH